MKKKFVCILLVILSNITNGYVISNSLKSNKMDNTKMCLSQNKKILYNSISLLKSSIHNQNDKKKWEPIVGYIPERLKIKKNEIKLEEKKWEPIVGYVPKRIKTKNKILEKINKLEYDINKLKNNIKNNI
tara:strand:- start:226 stop:615 length:390 start_codon:yes stop_codon:yes gene_type:complete